MDFLCRGMGFSRPFPSRHHGSSLRGNLSVLLLPSCSPLPRMLRALCTQPESRSGDEFPPDGHVEPEPWPSSQINTFSSAGSRTDSHFPEFSGSFRPRSSPKIVPRASKKPSRFLKSYGFKEVLGLSFSCGIFLEKRGAVPGCAQVGFGFLHLFFPSFKASRLKILQFKELSGLSFLFLVS